MKVDFEITGENALGLLDDDDVVVGGTQQEGGERRETIFNQDDRQIVLIGGGVQLTNVLVLQLVKGDWVLLFSLKELACTTYTLLVSEVDVDMLHVFKNTHDVDVVWVERGEQVLNCVQLEHLVV